MTSHKELADWKEMLISIHKNYSSQSLTFMTCPSFNKVLVSYKKSRATHSQEKSNHERMKQRYDTDVRVS
jgi:isocitrate lyase